MKRVDESKLVAAALERLYKRQNFGIKMDLLVEEAFLRHAGHPELNYGSIHVAGTNGKGSVCAMLDSILRCAGHKVGLYTSPHLVRFNERIKVDNVDISDSELAFLFRELEPMIERVAKEERREPTFFECTTAMALDYFAAQGVKLAVLETGMGGRLDATNAVIPVVSVITRISLEHTKYLGTDIPSIAGEKAGIIKKGRPVVCGAMPDDAMEVMRVVASQRHCDMVPAAEAVSIRLISADLAGQKVSVETQEKSYGTVHLPLLGPHQLENLATVVATVDCLNDTVDLGITEDAVRKGVAGTRWPGRMQVLSMHPPIILDGAHNPGAAEVLVATLGSLVKDKPVGLVAGMCNDKDMDAFLKPFTGLVKKAWAVPLKTERSRPSAELAAAARLMGWDVEDATVAEAIQEGTEWARQNGGVLCICGSLFLVGEVLAERPTLV
ncbi:MAG: bifunctional folylpolyglutamate synthase/dihydrofolate synthase [Verrucomicrobia bacterium]|nr:bifunctional folylpolyglutamate synthase/dihydrofolate synthase [Verrucomicrobiota bacterium]